MPENKASKNKNFVNKQDNSSGSKTKSRLPNKSLTDAEVARKSEKAKKNQPTKTEEKTTSKTPEKSGSDKSSIKVITKKSSKKVEKKEAKKTAQTTSKTVEAITIRTKPSTKSSKLQKNPKTPATSTTVKVIKSPKAPSNPRKTLGEVKPQSTDRPETLIPKTKRSESQKNKVPEETKSKPKKTANQRTFSFLSTFSQVIATILGFSSLFFIGMLVNLDVLPTKYLLPVVLIIIIIASGFGLLLARKKPKALIKVPVNILSIILSCVYLVGGGYIAEASGFLDSLKPQEYVSEQYYVVVKNDSDFQDIKELEGKVIGTFNEGIELYQEAIKELTSIISADLKDFQSAHAMADNLLSGDIDAIFISAIHKSVIDEDSADFRQNTKVLYTIEVKVKAETTVEHPNIDITSEPFTIYISGNDSYGDLAARGLSDVNMLVTVNPVTHEVLLTSIPRDCFVQLHGTTGIKDKLTHAGMYGVQMSIQTIEDLLDINIDYYIKINFPALISLVDAIGGIDVYSDKTFKPLHGDEIVKEGMNHFDGAMALAFARERMAYSYGDRHRVQNQRDVLNAIIQKVSSSPVILTKTNEILNSLSSNLDTNISKSEISSLVKLQLDSMPSWKIAEYMVNGSDLYTYTYTFDDQPRYVMPPYPESIETAHDYITGIMKGKTIEELKIPEPEKSWK